MREYTVTKDKNGYWYAHQVGYPNYPVWGSFSKIRKCAVGYAAASMGLTYQEYVAYRKHLRKSPSCGILSKRRDGNGEQESRKSEAD